MGSVEPAWQSVRDNIFISGLHAVYPENVIDDEFLDHIISSTLTNDEQAAKLRAVNKKTGIKSRPVVLKHNDPFYHRPEPFKVEELTDLWLQHGVPLSQRACLGAIADWGGNIDEITHLVAATGSVQCHPGFDAHVAHALKLRPHISRTLLSGVGCAGAAALLRTAHELSIAMTYRNKPARILVIACDLNSLGFRSEVKRLNEGHFPVGLTLFSDAATAAVVSNGIDSAVPRGHLASTPLRLNHPLFEIREWTHHTIPDTLNELQLMPTAIGPVSTISKSLTKLIPHAVKKLFYEVISSMPELVDSTGKVYREPSDFDWDVHPGGLGIFDRIIEVMGITRDHTSATVNAYENWGNSAGPTLLKVLDVRRSLPVKREFIVCCGFGNNIDITMLILRRC